MDFSNLVYAIKKTCIPIKILVFETGVQKQVLASNLMFSLAKLMFKFTVQTVMKNSWSRFIVSGQCPQPDNIVKSVRLRRKMFSCFPV